MLYSTMSPLLFIRFLGSIDELTQASFKTFLTLLVFRDVTDLKHF